jgi:serine/threonine protein phosphatase PrpC
VGRQREHNEDSLFSMSAVISDDAAQIPVGIFIIADGMGGHQHGEIASGAAIRAMGQYLMQAIISPVIGFTPGDQGETIQEALENGVKKAQQAVLHSAPGGGTTLTTALIVHDKVTIAHVGDSRAYFITPDGKTQVITQDHSLVKRLVELGQITEEEARYHPQRNVLYRAVGQLEPFRPEINSHQMPNPGYLLLCSDGLWGVVPEADIYRLVIEAPDLTSAAHSLVNAANKAGGPDNISVVIIQYLE